MSVIDTLITDRTQADVDRVIDMQRRGWSNLTSAEQAEYNTDMKGAYNYLDFIRVAEAVEYLCNEMLSILGDDFDITIDMSWSDGEIPSQERLEAYLANVRFVKDRLSIALEIPSSMDYLTYSKANAIEKLLVQAQQYIENIIASFVYCGQPYCGQIWEEFTA